MKSNDITHDVIVEYLRQAMVIVKRSLNISYYTIKPLENNSVLLTVVLNHFKETFPFDYGEQKEIEYTYKTVITVEESYDLINHLTTLQKYADKLIHNICKQFLLEKHILKRKDAKFKY